jgi:hypothetical protein
LQNPDADTAARGVQFLLQVDREKNFLEDVLGFSLVSNDPVGNRENQTAVAME